MFSTEYFLFKWCILWLVICYPFNVRSSSWHNMICIICSNYIKFHSNWWHLQCSISFSTFKRVINPRITFTHLEFPLVLNYYLGWFAKFADNISTFNQLLLWKSFVRISPKGRILEKIKQIRTACIIKFTLYCVDVRESDEIYGLEIVELVYYADVSFRWRTVPLTSIKKHC